MSGCQLQVEEKTADSDQTFTHVLNLGLIPRHVSISSHSRYKVVCLNCFQLGRFQAKSQATREGSFCRERTRLTRGRHVWHAHEMGQRVLCRKSLYDTNLNRDITSQHWMMKHQIHWSTTEISRSKSQSIGVGSQQ